MLSINGLSYGDAPARYYKPPILTCFLARVACIKVVVVVVVVVVVAVVVVVVVVVNWAFWRFEGVIVVNWSIICPSFAALRF